MRRVCLLIAAAVVGVAGPAAAPGRAHLSLTARQPPNVKGTGFHRHEQVTVVVRQNWGERLTRHARATGGGGFAVTFTDSIPPCGNFTVSATGSQGSRATLTGMRFPDCVIR